MVEIHFLKIIFFSDLICSLKGTESVMPSTLSKMLQIFQFVESLLNFGILTDDALKEEEN